MRNTNKTQRNGFKMSLLASAIIGASGLALTPQAAWADCSTSGATTTCDADDTANITINQSPHQVVVEDAVTVERALTTDPIFDLDASGQTDDRGLFDFDNAGTVGDAADGSDQPAIRLRGNRDAAGDGSVTSVSLNNT